MNILTRIFASLMPLLGMLIFFAVFVVGIIFFSYILILVAIIGFILFAIAYLRARLILHRKTKNEEKKPRQTVDHQDHLE